MRSEQHILEELDEKLDELSRFAKEIWEHPQIALQETFASKLLADRIEDAGFSLSWGAGGMDTAFVAEWGTGSPVIGFLGEYDALPGLSQEVSPVRRPVETGGPGHGCGHNLFGTACLGATLALRNAMESGGIPGTIRFYGCPAEETLTGKTFMARDEVFNDLDAAISWHPGSKNIVWNGSSLALNSFKVNFHGVPAHAGGVPWLGRSALDAVMLMDVGVNYLREHVPPDSRIHSVVTNGGMAPNVVPEYAQVWYYVRAPHRRQVEEIYSRMLDIAEGAALMTGTTHDIDFLTGCYDVLPNDTLSDLLLDAMKRSGGIRFTDDERTFARRLQQSFPEGAVQRDLDWARDSSSSEIDAKEIDDPLWERILPHSSTPPLMGGSTEVGDVSWITPTGQLKTTCWPLGTPGHSWQTVASSGSSIGAKGMLFAAKAMALAGLDLLTKPELLEKSRADFDAARSGETYRTPLPEGTVPK